MKKVITYGTYDLLHFGHIRLLERAKALGDYLIVGVTADDFDKKRGKINVQQSLMERIEAVKSTGLADKIIIEEYEGQKIDDIQKYDIDIFTVGSDWVGKFDYLKDYCEVVYLDRTEGVSSSDIRINLNKIRIGIIGDIGLVEKHFNECQYVNGIEVIGIYTENKSIISENMGELTLYDSEEKIIDDVDAVFVFTHPEKHYMVIKKCLEHGKHVFCESPISINAEDTQELFEIASKNNCILFDSIKTAYATAYNRALLLVKGGKIGNVISVSSTCTSLRESQLLSESIAYQKWNSICAWGPTAMLPILQLLGTRFNDTRIVSRVDKDNIDFDGFSKIDFVYDNSVATAIVGKQVKSEGEMIISGTKGYVYIPAPWWKTDYFEIRYEDSTENKRYFYQLDGEGIRNEIVLFARSIKTGKNLTRITQDISIAISSIIERFYKKNDIVLLNN